MKHTIVFTVDFRPMKILPSPDSIIFVRVGSCFSISHRSFALPRKSSGKGWFGIRCYIVNASCTIFCLKNIRFVANLKHFLGISQKCRYKPPRYMFSHQYIIRILWFTPTKQVGKQCRTRSCPKALLTVN